MAAGTLPDLLDRTTATLQPMTDNELDAAIEPRTRRELSTDSRSVPLHELCSDTTLPLS